MARFVVDCGVVLRLAGEEIDVAPEHELLAPTLLRSQTLSALHQAVHAGEVSSEVARERLRRIQALPVRLLGDATNDPEELPRDLGVRDRRRHRPV